MRIRLKPPEIDAVLTLMAAYSIRCPTHLVNILITQEKSRYKTSHNDTQRGTMHDHSTEKQTSTL